MIGHIQGLPVMPAVALEVLDSMAGADTDIKSLARRITQDQAIAARVLRVANSPFYGLQMRVSTIHDAIVVLGFSAVRSLVLAAAIVTSLPAGRCPGFSQDRFWRHVLGTAVAAQALAKPLKRPAEPLFIAGLLHDIGRLVMVALYPEHYTAVIDQAREQDCCLRDVEQAVFGYDHAAVGAALAGRWNFPADIVDALAWHHAPEQGVPGGLAAIIHYADAISQALDLEETENSQMPRLHQEAVDGLGLDWQKLTEVLADTQTRFESYRLMLG
jgi:putative nucleotidyltransferase with HDIG domain